MVKVLKLLRYQIHSNLIFQKISVYHLDVYSILAQLNIPFEFLPFQPKEKNYIVLNCGSSLKWISKRLPIHKWQEIANVLYETFQLPFILTGKKQNTLILQKFQYHHVSKQSACGQNDDLRT